MSGKRKRTRPNQTHNDGQKRQKISHPLQSGSNSKDPIIKHALLAQYYPQVFTLRGYLLQRLPNTSKIRRKKILSVGRRLTDENRELEEELAAFLDQTLVGESVCREVSKAERWTQWKSFSQRADDSASTLISLSSPGVYSQFEVSFPSISKFQTNSTDCRFLHLAALLQEIPAHLQWQFSTPAMSRLPERSQLPGYETRRHHLRYSGTAINISKQSCDVNEIQTMAAGLAADGQGR